ncbi:HAD-superfamily subfamily IIA hydrolase [Microbotryum lychnidis-dioicae p1A1 Lamole]|uniref:HAD-superfamily subfamily IIA hydrolase n=1 Tax=Microbotryum lychnidis-dioicae (strain p1A1 Lamole / MvSl-1064) TaxID=683840 RepID=U5GZ17_USTV1|nr:HAD-superfamily subfamily IIA hydrolase [Microbotryum lychnidis-dioicae p1A1 Lamole]|eukprot:KDE09526.1 HAD-superfamily subfamily IIA hydrolase [Microbotryum lychnidis-dioicae p1A1 Lamole]
MSVVIPRISPVGLGCIRRPSLACATSLTRRRLNTSSGSRKPVAFAFDIDGVLKQGSHVLPQAKRTFAVLSGQNKLSQKFPFICLTNGGGSIEATRAQRLTRELGVEIGEGQVVQSHTIFRGLVPQFEDKPVLVIGGIKDHCRKVAQHYGFKHVYIPEDVLHWQASVWPFQKLTEKEVAYAKADVDFSEISFAAILVFHDSFNWGRDVQLICDVLSSSQGVLGTSKLTSEWESSPQLPVHFSNPDLLWGNEFSQPRFGQGAFQESVAAVWKRTYNKDLIRTTGGKPTSHTYKYASSLLSHHVRSLSNPHTHSSSESLHEAVVNSDAGPIEGNVYMLGDNPASDIAGANAFGWESILVRTGVFRGDVKDAEHRPTIVKDDVWEGVKWALQREGWAELL